MMKKMNSDEWRTGEDMQRSELRYNCINDGKTGNIPRYKQNNIQGAAPVKKNESEKSKKLNILKPQKQMDYVAEAERILSGDTEKAQRFIEILEYRRELEPIRPARWYKLIDLSLVGICTAIIGLLIYALVIV